MIILTASEDKNQLAQALKLGCSGIVLKQATAEEIANCIRSVYDGRIWLDPRITTIVSQSTPTRPRQGNCPDAKQRPTRSQRAGTRGDRLVAQGYTNPEIAAKLFISGQTVKNHLHHIYKKTGFKTRAELISMPFIMASYLTQTHSHG